MEALICANGSRCEAQGEIKGMVHHFYDDLFSSETCTSVDAVIDVIPSKVMANRCYSL
jgi:hypothetical protein